MKISVSIRHLLLATVLVCSPSVSALVTAQDAAKAGTRTKSAAIVRTPWGDPDLQGVWTNTSEAATPFERPKEYADRQITSESDVAAIVREQHQRAGDPAARQKRIDIARTGNAPENWYEHLDAAEHNMRPWLVIDPSDGKIPAMTADGQKRVEARRAAAQKSGADGPESMSAWVRCITRGVPDIMLPTWYNNNYQIVQAPGYVAIVYEMIHEMRIIPVDGSPHLPMHMRLWLGDSRGHWDGDTLVVDVTNFTEQTSYRGSGREMHVVERFRRVGPDRIDWQVRVDDPATWTRPWAFSMPLTRSSADSRMFEYACHEGNSSMETILRGARTQEKASAATKSQSR